MSRRIEVELTSSRDDGSWTWRAAGARQPKGVLDGALLPAGTQVGAVLRADVEVGIDGTEVIAVLPPKGARAEPERIEIVGRPRNEELVTTTLVGKGRRDRGERGDRGDREGGRDRRPGGERGRSDRTRGPGGPGGPGGSGDRPRSDRPRGDRPGGGRPSGDRPGRGGPSERENRRGPRNADAARAESSAPAKPRAKRLRPGRVHRKAVLDSLPSEQQVLAEQVLKGGIPAVRQAVIKQNEQSKTEGKPEIKAEPLVAAAEALLPRLRAAEWRDRAEAALADIAELDLRDLRSVVVASDGAARDDETRALASALRDGLALRVEQEQSAWLEELVTTLADGRVVRALRISSRPPKAGSPLPPDLAARLIDAASASLTAEDGPDRWATVLDALQFSPVHEKVEPASLPAEPSEALLAIVRKSASRLPQIAAKFGIEPGSGPKRPRGARPKNAPVPPPPPRTDAVVDAPEASPVEDVTPEGALETAPETAETPPVEESPAEGSAAEEDVQP